jgi:predicted nucleic acid-binding protein
MIVLDTNIVSELMRDVSERAVVAWLDRQIEGSIWITTITVFEVVVGLELLPQSRRRSALSADFERFMDSFIGGRVMAFDSAAARAAARLMAERRRAGRSGELRDTMIAGIALSTGATLATRNVRHFEDLSVTIIDPWTA